MTIALMPITGLSERMTPMAALRVLLLLATLAVTPAHADDYAEVNRLVRAGQLTEAMARADQYLAGKPRDPQMRFLKGVIQSESGKTDEAIATYVSITQDYPELPEPYNNLAVLYASRGQLDNARSALEMAIRNKPGYATAHENLGDIHARLASRSYARALQLDSGSASVPPKLALVRSMFPAEPAAARPPASPAARASAPR